VDSTGKAGITINTGCYTLRYGNIIIYEDPFTFLFLSVLYFFNFNGFLK